MGKICPAWQQETKIMGWHNADEPITKTVNVCWGTKEREACECDGDRSKCDFYENIRAEASAKQRPEDGEIERESQHVEICLKDIAAFLPPLLAAGYECVLSQDGESIDIVMIDYLNPKFTGHHFCETEC